MRRIAERPHHASVWTVGLLAGILLCGSVANAQSTAGAIAGVVRDTTGAVLPGVTVEAASPALIEKSRSAVTDGQGNYKIVDLRPGTYAVTFTLPGFATVRREGIDLTTGFTATVNAELKVGAVEETVTVTGASPIVDVQNVRTQSVLSREQLDVLPTSRTQQAMTALTLGATLAPPGQSSTGHDVGGAVGEGTYGISIHGARPQDHQMFVDGMSYSWSYGFGGGAYHVYAPNQWITQEVMLETSGMSAEAMTAGLQMNFVPKDGGNRFHSVLSGNYTDQHLQNDNLDEALIARGVNSSSRIRRVYDVGGGVGGRLVRDRLWFYAAQRKWHSSTFVAGNYFNKTLHSFVYTPDLDRQAYTLEYGHNTSGRLTWQASAKHKLAFFEGYQSTCQCHKFTGLSAPEAAYSVELAPVFLTQGTWTYTASSRLLLQAGVTVMRNPALFPRDGGATNTDVPVFEQSTGRLYNARTTSPVGIIVSDYGFSRGDQENSRFSISYVTGSHAFKTGLQHMSGVFSQRLELNEVPELGPVRITLLNGRPAAVTYYASPFLAKNRGLNLALYAQDQWTLRRMTLNLGVRFDYNHQSVPEQTLSGGRYYPPSHFDAVDVTSWRDINPRLGAAYDLFGNGKTAVKGAIGRYVLGDMTALAIANNPAFTLVSAATRVWSDTNEDFFPQAEELGPLSNAAFGTSRPVTRYDPAILRGWHVRPYNWQASASVSHELRPGLGVMAGYFRTWYGNFMITDNLLVTPDDYDPYCVTTPIDTRLPGGGGQQICGLYDIRPSAFGRVSNLVTTASKFGKQREVYNGLEFVVNARFNRGGLLSGGVSTATTNSNTCFVVDSPQQLYQCDQTASWRAQTQIKLSGSYPLPWGLAVSGVLQNLSGVPRQATFVATNAGVAPSLGRNLGACGTRAVCAATVTVGAPTLAGATGAPPRAEGLGFGGLLTPYTQFEKRLTQVDLRVTRTFTIGRTRVQPQFDLYNAFNSNSILIQNPAYGPAWQRPTLTLPGRFVKFGAQVDF